MLADLSDLFGATIEHAPATGFNAYSDPVYGTPTPYRARVLYRARLVRDRNGQQSISRGEVWIAAPLHVGLQDRITLPDGTTPNLIAAELLSDEAGPSHAHIYFG